MKTVKEIVTAIESIEKRIEWLRETRVGTVIDDTMTRLEIMELELEIRVLNKELVITRRKAIKDYINKL